MANPTDPPPAADRDATPTPQICCDCGYLTREPIKVGEAYAAAGAGRDVYACPRHAGQYLAGGTA